MALVDALNGHDPSECICERCQDWLAFLDGGGALLRPSARGDARFDSFVAGSGRLVRSEYYIPSSDD